MNVTQITGNYGNSTSDNYNIETILLYIAIISCLISELLPFIPEKYFKGNDIIHSIYTFAIIYFGKLHHYKNKMTIETMETMLENLYSYKISGIAIFDLALSLLKG
jgi:hypothetical protein